MSEEEMVSDDLKLDVVSLPVYSVVVFADRAEVRRTIKCELDTGAREITVYNLAPKLDPDSIRVEGRGKATITEVTYQTKTETRDKTDPSQVKDINDEIDELEQQKKALTTRKSRILQSAEILNGVGQQVKTKATNTTTASGEEAGGGIGLLSSAGLDGTSKFLHLYLNESDKLDQELFRLETEIRELDDKLTVLKAKVRVQSHSVALKTIRQVSILLDCKEPGEVNLTISYLVTGASWEPKYDIRAFSQDQIVKVTYFGLIKQQTGEDWNEAKFFLSTASPSTGGNVPTLPVLTAHFKIPVVPMYESSQTANSGGMMLSMIRRGYRAMANSNEDSFAQEQFNLAPEVQHAAMEVQKGGLSTSYEIARKSSIPSDNTEHKVTVAMFDLKPKFEHISIPKMVESAFLKAKLVNDSPYLILAGPTSVFMDNDFITKASLPTVSSMEEFECSLGVDSAVRVTYKPCQKYNETAGGLLSSKTKTTRYKQIIEVKNTHQRSITIQVKDQLPRSSQEKIKVVLVAPVLPKEKEKGATAEDAPVQLNSDNHVVWKSVIKAQATETFLLHYTIESPLEQPPVILE